MKGGRKKGGSNTVLPKPKPQKLSTGNVCPDFVCVPIEDCTIPECPPNFTLRVVGKNSVKLKCPVYTCVPPPLPRASCNITGRTFHTFDGTEFKYDICNHILARDLENDNWDISGKFIPGNQVRRLTDVASKTVVQREINVTCVSVYKDCPEVTAVCTQHLVIIQDEHEIQLHPDLSVDFNGYKYNVEQVRSSSLYKYVQTCKT